MTVDQIEVEEALSKRRLLVFVGRRESTEPRLMLDSVEWVDHGEPIASLVLRAAGGSEYTDLRASGGEREWHRFGTWCRYLEEVETAHAILQEMCWTLTPEESALLGALDSYAERCPERYCLAVSA